MQPPFWMEYSLPYQSYYTDILYPLSILKYKNSYLISLHISSSMDSIVQTRYQKIIAKSYNIDLSKNIKEIKPQIWCAIEYY